MTLTDERAAGGQKAVAEPAHTATAVAPARTAIMEHTAKVSAGPLRILYVEDNPLVREVTSELLAQDQREVVAMGTAEEALTEFKERGYDVVITDVSLPEMSGIDLARSILRMKPDASIIIASGYALAPVEAMGPRVRTIVKPFEASQIDSLISDLCTL
jgi:CheY-like chemotaxis protein